MLKQIMMLRVTKVRVVLFRAVLAITGLAAILVAAEASGAPIIDGRFDPAEGYTFGQWLNLAVEKSDTLVPGGQLWHHQDAGTGDVSVALTLPTTLVDNTYGDNAVGWGKGVAPSGKNHNFQDLLGSDKAQFTFTDGAGNTVLDVVLDYMSEVSGASGTYASLGVFGKDGNVPTGSAANVLGWGTSLDYNFNTLGFGLTEDSPATDAAYTENPDFAGWVWDVAYELQVTGSLFADNGFGGVAVPIVHASPNKIGKNKIYPEPDGGEVPEPASITLLVLGAGLALLRRRRR